MTDSPLPSPPSQSSPQKTPAEMVGMALGVAAVAALQAWLLSMVLVWFGVTLTFGQCLVVLFLFYSVRGNK